MERFEAEVHATEIVRCQRLAREAYANLKSYRDGNVFLSRRPIRLVMVPLLIVAGVFLVQGEYWGLTVVACVLALMWYFQSRYYENSLATQYEWAKQRYAAAEAAANETLGKEAG